MRRDKHPTNWQGFADLAMGLLAVFVLILLLVLVQVQQARSSAERAAEEARRAREESVGDWRTFAATLRRVVDRGATTVRNQDGARSVVRALMAAPCQLTVDDDWRLVFAEATAAGNGASLYESGETQLSARGAAALASCKDSFLRLAYCLAPADPGDCGPRQSRRMVVCREGIGIRGAKALNREQREAVVALRRDVEALVLEGNTDRVPYHRATVTGITLPDGAKLRFNEPLAESFVANANLGAERARQALGHLVSLLEPDHADDCDALDVLLSVVRVETPSFGRFQVGPGSRREGRVESPSVTACDPKTDACDAARSLRLRLRWREEALRKPYRDMIADLCEELADPTSALFKGMTRAGEIPSRLMSDLGCADSNDKRGTSDE